MRLLRGGNGHLRSLSAATVCGGRQGKSGWMFSLREDELLQLNPFDFFNPSVTFTKLPGSPNEFVGEGKNHGIAAPHCLGEVDGPAQPGGRLIQQWLTCYYCLFNLVSVIHVALQVGWS